MEPDRATISSNGVPEDDNLPSFLLVPKLQHMASVKICLILWNKDSSVRYIADNFYDKKTSRTASHRKHFWEVIYQKIVELINKLNLPEPLKQKIIHFNDAIGQELELWLNCSEWIRYTKKGNKKPEKPDKIFEYFKTCLVWNDRGIINYSATARNVILYSQHTRTPDKFELACDFCLEDILKDQFMEKLKRYASTNDCNCADSAELDLMPFWSPVHSFHVMLEELLEEDNYEERIRHYWACRLVVGDTTNFFRSDKILYGGYLSKLLPFLMNDCALRFIVDQFPPHEREIMVEKCTWRERTETQLYLLSRGSTGLQKEFYAKNIVLNNYDFKSRILWEDCHVLYFETYGVYFSDSTCLKIAERLVSSSTIGKIQLPVNIHLYTLWTSIREESRAYMLMNASSDLLAELLDTFLQFERFSLIEKLFLCLEKNRNVSYYQVPTKAENPRKKFKSVDHLCKSNHNKKLGRKIHFMSYYFLRPNSDLRPKSYVNPLKYEIMQNDALDVFAELCKRNEMYEIDKLLNSQFNPEEERKAYKSTLLYPIFHRLLVSDIIENDFLKSLNKLCPIVDLFINWYFEPEQLSNVENFKRELLYRGDVPVIECLIEQNSPKLKEVVRWFLSYDEAEFRKFKKSYRRHELISLI